MECAVRKLKASKQSVEWTPPVEGSSYEALKESTRDAESALREVITGLHESADESVRAEFNDGLGELQGIADALHFAGIESENMVALLASVNEAVQDSKQQSWSTRIAPRKVDTAREAEDMNALYERDVQRLFQALSPAWMATPFNAAEQMRRVCYSAERQKSAICVNAAHVRETARTQIAASKATAVGRGDHSVKLGGDASDAASPLAEMTSDVAHAHRVLAALVVQFESMGWNAPLAVAVLERPGDGEPERVTTYATSDGLAIWPEGLLLPAGTMPLSSLLGRGIADAENILGMALPVAKLLSTLDPSWDVRGLATTDIFDAHLRQNPECTQDAALTRAIHDAREVPPCVVRRENFAHVKPAQAVTVFEHVRSYLGEVLAPSTAHRQLIESRWLGTETPTTYMHTYMAWLLCEADVALRNGNPLDAVWPLTELEDVMP